jgi:hypothetical protein
MSRANEPAYPEHDTYTNRESDVQTDVRGGMTIREAFAMAAMQGLMACPTVSASAAKIAEAAVSHADALLAALAKPTEGEGR